MLWPRALGPQSRRLLFLELGLPASVALEALRLLPLPFPALRAQLLQPLPHRPLRPHSLFLHSFRLPRGVSLELVAWQLWRLPWTQLLVARKLVLLRTPTLASSA